MTREEEIRQNAHDYTYTNDHNWTWDDSGESRVDISEEISDAYLAGAHSRDEEIESLQRRVSMWKHEAEVAAKELDQLRNPWRDAKKEPPEEYKNRRSKPVLIRYGIDYTHYDVWRYNYEKHYWENMSIYPMTAPDYWMPIPEPPTKEQNKAK